jgi:hypothetical protein
MQACLQQKLSGSSFEGGYISGIPAFFHFEQLILSDRNPALESF